METTIIDARGLACPMPVIKVKQALDQKINPCTVIVDNEAAKENVIRFAENAGAVIDGVVAENGEFRIVIRCGDTPVAESAISPQSVPGTAGKTVVIGSARMGRGNDELGALLMNAFLYSLTQVEPKPKRIILFNHGVRLATVEAEAVDNLKQLVDAGVELLVCGTCLDFLNLKTDLKLGTVSNMYTIAECLLETSSTVTL